MPTKEKLIEIAMQELENGEDTTGVCHACGEVAYGVEPDARKYECESCGENQVYGCEETLIMLV